MFNLENIGFGFQTLVLGMLIVFLALAVIWFFVALIGKAFTKKTQTPEKTAPEKKSAAVSSVQTPVSQVAENRVSDNSAEIVAAITAAISCYENKPLGSFRVVSFKKR